MPPKGGRKRKTSPKESEYVVEEGTVRIKDPEEHRRKLQAEEEKKTRRGGVFTFGKRGRGKSRVSVGSASGGETIPSSAGEKKTGVYSFGSTTSTTRRPKVVKEQTEVKVKPGTVGTIVHGIHTLPKPEEEEEEEKGEEEKPKASARKRSRKTKEEKEEEAEVKEEKRERKGMETYTDYHRLTSADVKELKLPADDEVDVRSSPTLRGEYRVVVATDVGFPPRAYSAKIISPDGTVFAVVQLLVLRSHAELTKPTSAGAPLPAFYRLVEFSGSTQRPFLGAPKIQSFVNEADARAAFWKAVSRDVAQLFKRGGSAPKSTRPSYYDPNSWRYRTRAGTQKLLQEAR